MSYCEIIPLLLLILLSLAASSKFSVVLRKCSVGPEDAQMNSQVLGMWAIPCALSCVVFACVKSRKGAGEEIKQKNLQTIKLCGRVLPASCPAVSH